MFSLSFIFVLVIIAYITKHKYIGWPSWLSQFIS